MNDAVMMEKLTSSSILKVNLSSPIEPQNLPPLQPQFENHGGIST